MLVMGRGQQTNATVFLADCPWCQKKNFEEREKLAGSGRVLSPDAVRIVAEVDRQLAAALEAGQDNYLQLGPAFTSLPTWKSSGGSRHDHLVAFLCGCGPYDVRSARQKFQLSLSESIPLHSLGGEKRGQKRSIEFSNYSSSLAKPEESSERLVSQAPRKEEVVVGRLLSFALVHGIPDNAMVSLFSQLHNSGVPVGHKFHNRDGIRRFANAALTCARQNLKEQFLLPPRNCVAPSCFRLIFDSVTLPDGVTVLMLLVSWLRCRENNGCALSNSSHQDLDLFRWRFVGPGCAFLSFSLAKNQPMFERWSPDFTEVVFTSVSGDMVCLPVDDIPMEDSHGGPATAQLLGKSLRQHLLSDELCQPASRKGLPATGACRREQFCVAMCVDRAYSGRTGNKADALLGEKLGLPLRVGAADNLHCCNSLGSVAAPPAKKGGQKSAPRVSSSASSSSSGDSSSSDTESSPEETPAASDGGGTLLGQWFEMVRCFRSIFRHGIPRSHLAKAYSEEGLARVSVQGPSKTRMIVFSAGVLQQSLRHWRARYIACLKWAEHLETQLAANASRKDLVLKKDKLSSLKRSMCSIEVLSAAFWLQEGALFQKPIINPRSTSQFSKSLLGLGKSST